MPSKLLLSNLVFALAAGAALLAGQPPRGSATAVLFEGARLVAGDGGPAVESSAFLVENGRFTRVGRKGGLRAPSGAARIDLAGKTVMPALVDAHVHIGYRKGATFSADNYTRENILDQLNRLAYYGVAAVLSTGTDRGDLAFQIREAPPPGALLRTAWRGIAAPNGGPFPPMRDAPFGVTTEQEARSVVRELAAKNTDLIKIWVDDRNGAVPKLSPALYRAIIDEAHRRNRRVIAHIATQQDVKDLIRAGIDGFAHVFRDQEVDEELLGLLKERPSVFFMLTLWAPRLNTFSAKPEWFDDPFLRETASPEAIKQFTDPLAARTAQAVATSREDWARLARNIAKLDRASARLVLGTDVGGSTGGPLFGWAEHRELENMVAAGMTPAHVIVAATRTPAEVLALTQLGTVAAGKSADFIVLDANPLDDIANSRTIARVYLRGAEVDRAALRTLWKR